MKWEEFRKEIRHAKTINNQLNKNSKLKHFIRIGIPCETDDRKIFYKLDPFKIDLEKGHYKGLAFDDVSGYPYNPSQLKELVEKI